MDIKTEMIEAYERGECGYYESYDYVRERIADQADLLYKQAKERGYRNPLVADLFCQTCHYSENAHPRESCLTGFVAGDADEVRAANARLGF